MKQKRPVPIVSLHKFGVRTKMGHVSYLKGHKISSMPFCSKERNL